MKLSELTQFIARGLVARVVAYQQMSPVTCEAYYSLWFYSNTYVDQDYDSNYQNEEGRSVRFSTSALVVEFIESVGLDASIVTFDTSRFDEQYAHFLARRQVENSAENIKKAGAPKKPGSIKKKAISIKLTPDMIKKLKKEGPTLTAAIERAVNSYYSDDDYNELADIISAGEL
jgi:uncharacterized protein (DUF4415 family)